MKVLHNEQMPATIEKEVRGKTIWAKVSTMDGHVGGKGVVQTKEGAVRAPEIEKFNEGGKNEQ